jgi:multiple sugar transport system permease protein/raffinose/stachyose/melibiose transport system permease protein
LHWESVGGQSSYVGLSNFSKMVRDPVVQEAFLNALKVIATIPVWVLFPLALAFLIFQRTPGWGFFRAIFFLPYTIAPIIVGQIWRELLSNDGPFNVIFKGIGLHGVARAWLGDSNTALWAMVFVVLWTFSGLGIITYLAGFATIDEEIFDACSIDGAGYWTKIFRIILPMMWPIVGYWTILCTGGMLLWMFPFIFAMTEGGPGHATMLPEYLVYITAFRFNERGYGTAIGVGLFFFVLIFAFFQVRYMYQGGSAQEAKR